MKQAFHAVATILVLGAALSPVKGADALIQVGVNEVRERLVEREPKIHAVEVRMRDGMLVEGKYVPCGAARIEADSERRG
jgi:hypothetical protein